ncbi:MAG: dolichyl-phosphate beta-glucosyltransferase [Caeruleum heppii]|nr:MAG: dolichyl-phosphate beta-glucosyltransferase [Caeruleum heppii]
MNTSERLLSLINQAPLELLALLLVTLFRTVLANGETTTWKQLPCWHETFTARRKAVPQMEKASSDGYDVEPAELFMTVVVPAYNEEERLSGMLEEAIDYLETAYPSANGSITPKEKLNGNGKRTQGKPGSDHREIEGNGSLSSHTNGSASRGWEIILVSDGSTDRTIEKALNCARSRFSGGKMRSQGSIRVVSLRFNRGKGGAVTHGMRHARGQYVVFADADGASRFADLGKLVRECRQIEDGEGRGVAVGSRAHLVGSEAVVKRSFLRNLLMHSFHLFLRLLTPPATAAIKDTQCGFKLFSRASLPYIVPYMHSEGWIFDVEMLMLAELASIPVAEVAIGWREVTGSKLNVLWDSLGMAWGLFILRCAWAFGVYRRY